MVGRIIAFISGFYSPESKITSACLKGLFIDEPSVSGNVPLPWTPKGSLFRLYEQILFERTIHGQAGQSLCACRESVRGSCMIAPLSRRACDISCLTAMMLWISHKARGLRQDFLPFGGSLIFQPNV